ncbi:IS3 family transposase [Thomasclavelia cocleata]|uniref:IS3 family transposase n=1 Tax=Thomasclavelia cocleata TaxID=69824 RepID=UPI0032E8BB30
MKKRLRRERSWSRKGIRYYIQQEYKIIDEYKDKYSIISLCEYMSVSRSGYYKWKYRQEHPTIKMISRKSDIGLIKEIHKKHPSHGYRWINAYARNKYGVIWSDNHVHLCCKYENIKSQGKHYQWKKPDEEHEKFNNLVWNGWKYLSRPYEVIVSDMTAFKVKGVYYELTLYFDAWNKEIIGYGLVSRKGNTKSYYDGLNQVLSKIKEEQIETPIILHTDQGAVYSSTNYNNLLNEFNIQRSMSRAGTPTDNPVNESLNGWIKEELFIDFDLKHCEDVPNLIKLYINYYNNERPSYALNYKTPIQYKIESGF